MPSDRCNLTMAKAKGLIILLFDVTFSLAERCLLPYHCTYNAFFMNLLVPSFVFLSSLFTVKSVDFVVGM